MAPDICPSIEPFTFFVQNLSPLRLLDYMIFSHKVAKSAIFSGLSRARILVTQLSWILIVNLLICCCKSAECFVRFKSYFLHRSDNDRPVHGVHQRPSFMFPALSLAAFSWCDLWNSALLASEVHYWNSLRSSMTLRCLRIKISPQFLHPLLLSHYCFDILVPYSALLWNFDGVTLSRSLKSCFFIK